MNLTPEREIRSLTRTVHRLDLLLRSVADADTRNQLMERCRSIEWRINSLGTPAPYRMPH